MIYKIIFQILSKLNALILPKIAGKKDLFNLSNFDKLLIGYRYWVTRKYLDCIKEEDKIKLFKSFNIN